MLYQRVNYLALKHLGVSLSFLLFEALIRACLLCFVFLIPTHVDSSVYIPHHLLYKYSYPYLQHSSIPLRKMFTIIPICTITILFLTHIMLRRRLRWAVDLFYFILGYSMTFLLTCIILKSIKIGIRRPRPDFLFRCYGPNIADLQSLPLVTNCLPGRSISVIEQGLMSFPSSHCAIAWCSVGFLCFYIYEKIQFARQHDLLNHFVPSTALFFLGFLLCYGAGYVACSRVWDYRHHVEDVLAGSFIGLMISYFSFYLFYPLSPEILIISFISENIYKGYLYTASDSAQLLPSDEHQ